MSNKDEPIVLGFTKKEIEIIIMSLQVIKPNPCATNGCTVSSILRWKAFSRGFLDSRPQHRCWTCFSKSLRVRNYH